MNLIGLQFDVQREFGQNIFLIKKVEYLDADDVALYFENPESDLAFSKKFPRKFGGAAFSLRGSPTFMTNSGDWIQSANGELVVFPPSGSSDLGMSLIVPKLTTLLKIKGSSQKKIKNLIFSNLHFVETTWVKPLQGFVPSQASVVYFTENGTVAIPGAIEIEYAENLKIDQCFFENIGSSAVVAKEGVYNAEITRNIFSKISASAIVMGADLKKKPEPEGVSANGKILGNFITDVGTNYYGSVGIFLGYLSGSEIAFNTLKNMPYTAISVGWGWTKELTSLHSNSIHNNYISGAMKLLSDGGGIYLVSYQPETMIYNNYISDMRLSEWATFKFFSVIYLDNGVGGVNVFDNFYNNIYSSDGERGKFFFDQKGNLGNFYSSGRNLKINSIVFGVSGIY